MGARPEWNKTSVGAPDRPHEENVSRPAVVRAVLYYAFAVRVATKSFGPVSA